MFSRANRRIGSFMSTHPLHANYTAAAALMTMELKGHYSTVLYARSVNLHGRLTETGRGGPLYFFNIRLHVCLVYVPV